MIRHVGSLHTFLVNDILEQQTNKKVPFISALLLMDLWVLRHFNNRDSYPHDIYLPDIDPRNIYPATVTPHDIYPTTFTLNDIYPQRHLPSTTFTLNDIYPQRHLPSTTFTLNDIYPRDIYPRDIYPMRQLSATLTP